MPGFLASLVGGGAASVAVDGVEAIGKVADSLFTSDDERLTHAEVMERIKQRPELAQIEVNKAEAQHRTIFVAGWRPGIGWICAAGIGYHFIAQPLLTWAFVVAQATGHLSAEVPAPPPLDFAPLMTLVLSLLGLGSLRTYEKLNNKTS